MLSQTAVNKNTDLAMSNRTEQTVKHEEAHTINESVASPLINLQTHRSLSSRFQTEVNAENDASLMLELNQQSELHTLPVEAPFYR